MAVPPFARLPAAVALAVLVAASGSPIAWGQTSPIRTVLTIHTGAEDFPPNPVLDAAIREALPSRPDMEIVHFSEYLESEQFAEEEASLALGEYIRRKYRNRHVDLVIAITNPALQFVLKHRPELFPDAPVVFGGLQVPDEALRGIEPGIAAVKVGSAYSETLKLALELHPTTERVFVVARSPNKQNVEAVRAELQDFSQRITLSYVDEETEAGLLSDIKAIPPRSLILHIWHRQVAPGNSMSPIEVARAVAGAAAVPVYGTVDVNIGSGIVGGVVRRTHDTGTQIGRMARRILEGGQPQAIPVEAAPVVPMFDWRQVKRWGIDPSRLPPDADIQFRTRTPWETYRWYIISTILVVVAQLLLIAGLLTQRARRRRVEGTLRRSEAQLRTSYERIRQLTGRLIAGQEAARASMARDLHDDFCQQLVYVSMGVSSLKTSSGHIQDAQTQDALGDLEQKTNGMFEGIRRLSHDLHPASLRLLGVAPALKTHCSETARRHDVQVSFRVEGDLSHLHPDVAVCLFRIAQEALRNGIAHGHARRFEVALSRSPDHVELTVTDDGRGFDLEAVRRSGAGLGLVSMEERARIVGGDMEILTGPRRGTTIRVRGPVEPPQSSQPADADLRSPAAS